MPVTIFNFLKLEFETYFLLHVCMILDVLALILYGKANLFVWQEMIKDDEIYMPYFVH